MYPKCLMTRAHFAWGLGPFGVFSQGSRNSGAGSEGLSCTDLHETSQKTRGFVAAHVFLASFTLLELPTLKITLAEGFVSTMTWELTKLPA